MAKFIHYRQMDTMSCGPACLRMIARHFGKTLSMEQAEDLAYKGKQGVSLLAVCDAAEEMGLRSLPVQCGMDHLLAGRRVPFIAHWNQNHFIVVYHLTARHIYVADPAAEGLLRYSLAEFEAGWLSAETASGPRGIAVYFEVTPAFDAGETTPSKVNGEWRILRGYLASHQTLMVQLVLGTLLSAVLMFVSPFLTESLVDQGVQLGDRSFVTYFLIAQGCVLVGGTAIELIRSWVLLYVSSRLSVTLVADFLQAAMNLPLSFFDKRSSGDILQRLDDHQRIERFLTSHALDSLFSLVIVLVYGVIIAKFSPEVFAVFALGASLSILWVLKFLKARKQLDHRRFSQLSESRANEMELIRGITEIKLTGSQKQKRWGWERVQARLFKTNVSSMKLEQVQHSGSSLITSATMILTMGISANAVISGSMTLGTMMAISAMLGQLNVPLANFIYLAQEGQNAIMSFRRMAEVNMAAPEDSPDGDYLPVTLGDIALTDVSFRYGDLSVPFVLDAISLVIPRGKTTAIVGSSGSGKTTLLKLLLKFYDPEHGDIQIGGTSLAQLKARDWRGHCSGVMQDGFVFYDTIARNIAVTDEPIDRERLAWAAELADIQGFIEKLPLGYNTKVGDDGIGLSGGQRQRVLIARAVYSRPEYLLLDEATSALDTQAEATVSRNFARMTKGMTKIIIAHRLSTVRDADNIIVLEAGRIVETGSHAALTRLRGRYFELIRNQLELGA